MEARVRRGQRRSARYNRRARVSQANELAAEKQHGMGPPSRYNPSDLSSPHWFDADEPPKAFLDKEQARRNGFGRKR